MFTPRHFESFQANWVGSITPEEPCGPCRSNRRMNGGQPKIEIFKPFGEAFELTKKILFQPFDFTKWLVIGFAAFLCGHFSAGGFNFPFGNFNPQPHRNFTPPNLESWKP